jgi:hypothetical protein
MHTDVMSVHEIVHIVNTGSYYTEITDYESAKISEYQFPIIDYFICTIPYAVWFHSHQ